MKVDITFQGNMAELSEYLPKLHEIFPKAKVDARLTDSVSTRHENHSAGAEALAGLCLAGHIGVSVLDCEDLLASVAAYQGNSFLHLVKQLRTQGNCTLADAKSVADDFRRVYPGYF